MEAAKAQNWAVETQEKNYLSLCDDFSLHFGDETATYT
jgi:hypothetical protein